MDYGREIISGHPSLWAYFGGFKLVGSSSNLIVCVLNPSGAYIQRNLKTEL
jgi:hypothetical protein